MTWNLTQDRRYTRTDTAILVGLPALDDPAEKRRLRWLAAWFYVGVPLLLGFLLGWLQVGRASAWPRDVSLFYWIAAAMLSTALLGGVTHALAPLLRRLRSPLWLTLIIGQLFGGPLLVRPVLEGLRTWMKYSLNAPIELIDVPWFAAFVQVLPSNMVMWVGLNLLFFHGLQMPRFGYVPWAGAAADDAAPAEAAAPSSRRELSGSAEPGAVIPQADLPDAATAVSGLPSSPLPPFMGRVRPERRGRLLALESDGHYLRVHTDAGSDLVLYRLSDAIHEIDTDDGARVHRSWWVAGHALSAERHAEMLKLVNGLEVPVSRTYRLSARERGWLLGKGPLHD